jgi:hypothetical protein
MVVLPSLGTGSEESQQKTELHVVTPCGKECEGLNFKSHTFIAAWDDPLLLGTKLAGEFIDDE